MENEKPKFDLKAYVQTNKKALLKKGMIVLGAAVGVFAVALLVKNDMDNSEEGELLTDEPTPIDVVVAQE